jgi:type II secretory pathway pseudopilin PulG
MNQSKNENGFTLIELTVAGGILVVIAYLVMDVMNNQQKVVKTFDASTEASQLSLNLTNLLADQRTCNQNLLGMIPSATPTPDSSWGPTADPSSGRTDGSLCISRDDVTQACTSPIATLNITNGPIIEFQLLPPQTLSNEGIGIGNLRITFQKDSAPNARNTLGANRTERLIPFSAIFCEQTQLTTPALIPASLPAHYLNSFEAEAYLLSLCQSIPGVSNPYIYLNSLKILDTFYQPPNNWYRWIAQCFHSCGINKQIQTCY